MRQCPNGHEVGDNVKYCPTCGAEIISGNKFCTKCGNERKGAEKFCPKCGTPFDNVINDEIVTYEEEQPKSGFKKYLPYILGTVVVLAIIGYFGSKDSKGDSVTATTDEALSVNEKRELAVSTRILNGNSQPPIVGGVICGYSDKVIQKKGIIVSLNSNSAVYNSSVELSNPYSSPEIHDYRVIDCTEIGKEQFWCTLKTLVQNRKYYVRAFLIKSDGDVLYGEKMEIQTKKFNRYNGKPDVANVFKTSENTVFDLVSDEILSLNDGYYYSTNESPTTVKFQKEYYNVCYKFKSEWNYKLWYYHSAHCDQSKIVSVPIMTLSDNKLTITRNPLDKTKSINLYYSINGDYFHPEKYANKYNQPIEIVKPCAVYCYAISSDGYISYTNIYVVGNYISTASNIPPNVEGSYDDEIEGNDEGRFAAEDDGANETYSSSSNTSSSSRTFYSEQIVIGYLANQSFRASDGLTMRVDGDGRLYVDGDYAGVLSVLRYSSTAALLRYGGGMYGEGKLTVQIVGDKFQLKDPTDGTVYYQR